MRLLGTFLNERDITVCAPLLPGHGTEPADLNRVTWQDWVNCVERELLALRERCQTVFVAGLSMGTLLAIHLSVMYPDIPGIVLYSPALKAANSLLPLASLLKHLVKFVPAGESDLTDPEAGPAHLWHYEVRPVSGAAEMWRLQRQVRAEIKDVHVPAIVFYSTLDQSIHPTSGPLTFEGLGSEDKELVTLHNSGHCMTVDTEKESVFARTYGFIVAHANGD